jgi:hypothetical protein
MKNIIIWNMTQCSLVDHLPFGGIYYHHLQNRRIRQASNQQGDNYLNSHICEYLKSKTI